MSVPPGSLSPERRARDLDAVGGLGRRRRRGGRRGHRRRGRAGRGRAAGCRSCCSSGPTWPSGTSRWSSKLVHGGLRYLAHGEIGLARESARERAVLMGTTAPHLVRPLPFLVPDAAGRDVTALAAAGGRLGDAVRLSVPGGRGSLPSTRRVSAGEVARLVPGVRPGRGGVVFWDGQLADDARLVVALARTAAAHGARVLTGADGDRRRRRRRARRRRRREALTLRAGVVVNAAGVWAQRLAPRLRLVPSRGSHLVLRAERLGLADGGAHRAAARLAVAVRLRAAAGRRAGLPRASPTSRSTGPVPDDDPVPSDAEVAQLLETVNQVLAEPLTSADVVGAYAGLRPLVLPASAGTGPGERDRRPLPQAPAVVGRTGPHRGRRQAHHLPGDGRGGGGRRRRPAGPRRGRGRRPPGCRWSGRRRGRCSTRLDAPPGWSARYGTEAPAVAALGDRSRWSRAGRRRWGSCGSPSGTRVRGRCADLLDRRTRIGLVPADRARAVEVAEQVLADESGVVQDDEEPGAQGLRQARSRHVRADGARPRRAAPRADGARVRRGGACAAATWVLGEPKASGPADQAPVPPRGKALRQLTILRVLAVERVIRAVVLIAAGLRRLPVRERAEGPAGVVRPARSRRCVRWRPVRRRPRPLGDPVGGHEGPARRAGTLNLVVRRPRRLRGARAGRGRRALAGQAVGGVPHRRSRPAAFLPYEVSELLEVGDRHQARRVRDQRAGRRLPAAGQAAVRAAGRPEGLRARARRARACSRSRRPGATAASATATPAAARGCRTRRRPVAERPSR